VASALQQTKLGAAQVQRRRAHYRRPRTHCKAENVFLIGRFSCGPVTAIGGWRYAPYAFTERGVAMLSTVLNSPRAITANIEIMRAFVRLRLILASNKELDRRLDALEAKADAKLSPVFEAIRQLTTPPEPKKRPIGFVTANDK
jgi:hypothetical protein